MKRGAFRALGALLITAVAAGGLQAAEPDKAALEKQAKDKLDGTTWQVNMTPLSGESAEPIESDRIQFKEGKVASEALEAEGYPPSNFTVSITGNGMPVWETMQTSPTHGVAFWRGEMRDGAMRGVLSIQPTEGEALNYSFNAGPTEAGEWSFKPAEPQRDEPVAPAAGTAPEQQAEPAAVMEEEAYEDFVTETEMSDPEPPAESAGAPAEESAEEEPKKEKRRGWW